ncbi:hypothetical protein [Streptomyces albus]|uniref:hypothetical protein n=1 Tax=Streptomyces albus TaxID=1888 RepID=UPI00156FEBFB
MEFSAKAGGDREIDRSCDGLFPWENGKSQLGEQLPDSALESGGPCGSDQQLNPEVVMEKRQKVQEPPG